MSNEKHFEFGLQVGHLLQGVDSAAFAEKRAYSEALDASPEVSRLLCKVAASMFEACGKMEQFQYHLYDQLSKQADWHESFDRYVEPVVEALGRVVPELEEEELQKRAVAMPNALAGLFGRGAAMTPAALKLLAGAGILGGAGVGSLAWYANRDANEDEQDLEAMRARIDNYDRITGEISERLRADGSSPVTGDVKNMIGEVSGADYVS